MAEKILPGASFKNIQPIRKIVEKKTELWFAIFPHHVRGISSAGERMTGSHEAVVRSPFSTTHSGGGISRFFLTGSWQRLAQGTHNPWVGGSNPWAHQWCGEKPFDFSLSLPETLPFSDSITTSI